MPQRRETTTCPPGQPICPSCGKPIRRLTVSRGSTYTLCENNTPAGRCYQHVLILDVAGGELCKVVPISKKEFQQLTNENLGPRAALEQLGMVR